ncbi:MAG: CoA-binding protein [Candidatus Aenigmarchaeota archaeon]|nr:CoA-binding protein [Candidatus Aenigmarchaeota archaeon]
MQLRSEKKTSQLRYFFKPESVAVVGVSRNPGKFGHIIFENFLKSKYKGHVYAVNPKADMILGKKCYPSVKEIPSSIDLAVIVVPAVEVEAVLHDCIRKRVKAAVIVSAGFSEIGHTDMEKKITEVTRNKMRVIGPNVIGIFDSHTHVDTIFNPTHRQERPPEGKISFISQSGAFGAAIMDWSASEGIGLSKFISIGNRADVDEVDLLEYLARDKRTGAIAIYLEGAKNGRLLFETLKRITKRKPVVLLKAGRTKEGSSAVSSHTGSMAGESDIYTGMLKQSGTIEAKSIEELFEFSKALAYQPLPKSNRIAVITNGGGFGVLCADALIENGLKLAKLSDSTIKVVRKHVPDYIIVSNPMDLTGDAGCSRYEIALNAVMNDPSVDAVIVVLLLQISALQSDIVDLLVNFKTKKPILVCSTGGEYTNLHKKMLEKRGIPTYSSPERAAKAMLALVEYSQVIKKKILSQA